MTLSDLSIRKSVFAWMLMVGLILFGWISLKRIGISQMPDVDFPNVTIQINYEGAAPEVMETDVVDVLEDFLMSVEGIRSITSSSKQGQAILNIEFELSRNVDAALQDVNTKIDQAKLRLPQDLDPPMVMKSNPEDFPIMWISLSADKGMREMTEYVRDHLKSRIQTIPGIGNVVLAGYTDPNLRVWIDPQKLVTYELTVQDVLAAISKQHIEIPAGKIETATREFNIRAMGEALTPKDFENILIDQRGGMPLYKPIRIGDVARIEEGLAEIRSTSRVGGNNERYEVVSGKPALGLGITKQRGANAVEVANKVRERLEEIKKDLPSDYSLQATLAGEIADKLRKSLEEARKYLPSAYSPQINSMVDSIGKFQERLKEVRNSFSSGYSLQINFDATHFIQESVDEMNFELILATVLTSVVCLLFLASWSATFNVLLAIPTSLMGSFIFLHFLGFTLNTFTLLALTLSIGIVVDDAIMVLENIVRHREMGKSKMRAALDGAREITPAAIATTIAVIAIFMPVFFIRGAIGQFFLQFGVTMSVAVALSLLEALTLTPMRASRMGSAHGHGWFPRTVDRTFQKMSNAYERILRGCLKHRWIVAFLPFLILGGIALGDRFIVQIATAAEKVGVPAYWLPDLKTEFLPAQDQSMFLLKLETPIGSSLEFTNQKAKEAEALVSAHPEVLRYYSAIGGFGGGEINTAMIFTTLKPPGDRPPNPEGHRFTQEEMMNRVRDEIQEKIPGLKPFVIDLSLRGFASQSGSPLEFTIRGPDWEKLIGYSREIVKKMEEKAAGKVAEDKAFFSDIDTDFRVGQPEIQVFPKRDAAAARDVSIEAVGQTINALMGGVRSGKFTEHSRRNDIRVRLIESARQTSEDIASLYVRNSHGELIPLRDLVEIKERETLNSIMRKDRERAVKISANIAPGQSQDKAQAELERITKEVLPKDGSYRGAPTGSAEGFKEAFQDMGLALILGIAVSYMVLASQYNSFLHPIIILLALPFSIGGAWLTLRVFGASLNLYSFIGIILLTGIAKKNSILLVDFTNQRRKEGAPVYEALMTACPQRLRPILMTSFATLAAAIPAALALGPGGEVRRPMAMVIFGGIVVSTLLTLFVVPCAYSLMARLELKKKKIEDEEFVNPPVLETEKVGTGV